MTLSDICDGRDFFQNCSGLYFIADAAADQTDGAKDLCAP